MNTSDQRDGKHLLTQLQEATQSHQLPRTALVPPAESQQHMAHVSTGDQLLNGCTEEVVELEVVELVRCLQCFDAIGWATGRASGL